MGVHFDRVDLDYILTQIKMAEASQPPISALLAFGLRTVSGEDNSAVGGQGTFGSPTRPSRGSPRRCSASPKTISLRQASI